MPRHRYSEYLTHRIYLVSIEKNYITIQQLYNQKAGGEIMRTKEEIESEIAHTESELKNVCGMTTEVYARIVGYYRSVRNWNKGKREEFTKRKMFSSDNPKISNYASAFFSSEAEEMPDGEPAFLEVYTRTTCPNCPPVKNYCSKISIPVHFIDADTDDGRRLAAARNIRSCPTVLAYDGNKQELWRAYSVAELENRQGTAYSPEAVIA